MTQKREAKRKKKKKTREENESEKEEEKEGGDGGEEEEEEERIAFRMREEGKKVGKRERYGIHLRDREKQGICLLKTLLAVKTCWPLKDGGESRETGHCFAAAFEGG